MQTPLTTKEINYLRDHMSWELLQAKKCRMYATSAPQQQAGLFDQVGNIHRQNFETLVRYIETTSGSGGVH